MAQISDLNPKQLQRYVANVKRDQDADKIVYGATMVALVNTLQNDLYHLNEEEMIELAVQVGKLGSSARNLIRKIDDAGYELDECEQIRVRRKT